MEMIVLTKPYVPFCWSFISICIPSNRSNKHAVIVISKFMWRDCAIFGEGSFGILNAFDKCQ